MDAVNPNRLRWGACAWLLTLQFFVVETLAQSRAAGPYSRTADVISDLGATTFPAHRLMNASFVLQAALILAGALLLRPALRGGAARVAPVLLGAAAVGVLLVGVFPENGNAGVHATGAVLYLAGGGLGLIALAYAVRPHSEVLGTTLALLGLVGTAMTAFFLTGVTEYLGNGGTERTAAYVLPIGLAVAGAALWRMRAGAAPAAAEDPGERLTRRQVREQTRARRAEQDRLRDEALEAAAVRRSPDGARRVDAATANDGAEDDSDDPWAAPPRRRRD
jgi:hypothetical membrane protein